MLKEINLQLFAEEEIKKEEIKKEEIEELEESEEEEAEEESEEESEETKEKPVKKDKVTAAVIREKQENKKLRDELAEYRRKEEERERVKADSELKQKYLENGLTEEEADDKIADRRERQELKTELKRLKYGKEADKLEAKYPDIQEHLDSFISIVEASKGSLTLSELCKAKLDKSSEFEQKTKTEQEGLLKKAASKKLVMGEDKQTDVIKFNAEDEEAYKFYVSKNPGKSRKDYNEILKTRRG